MIYHSHGIFLRLLHQPMDGEDLWALRTVFTVAGTAWPEHVCDGGCALSPAPATISDTAVTFVSYEYTF